MATDPTEQIRRKMVETNAPALDRVEAEANQEQTWDTEALMRDFETLGFMSPFVVVRRRSDGVKGSLEFTHSPRVYFNFRPEGES